MPISVATGGEAVRKRPKAAEVLASLLVLAARFSGSSNVVQAGEPLDSRLGTRTAPIILLTRRDVQKELGLTGQQIAEANRQGSMIYEKALRLKGRKDTSVLEARRAIDDEAAAWLKTHLTDSQYARLHQIDLQWEGVAAMMTRPIIAESLSISPEQRHRLAPIVAARHDPRRTQQPWTLADHEHLARRALPLLSDRQQQLWTRLLGPAVPFAIDATHEAERELQAPHRPGSRSDARGPKSVGPLSSG
jgi:hypothetical protein